MSMVLSLERYKRIERSALALIFLCLFVILWGAFVRFSHSGDGCGESWPLCHGAIVPLIGGSAVWIEYVHRITSGLFGIGVAVLVLYIFCGMRERGQVHNFSLAVLFFTITEALIGAGLVLRGMVADNASLERMYWLIGHLINTLFLLYFLVALFIQAKFPSWKIPFIPALRYSLPLLFFIAIAMFGSVASLSGTLYPSVDLFNDFAKDFSSESPLLIRLRILHPCLGILFFLSLVLLWNPYREIRFQFEGMFRGAMLVSLVGATALVGLMTLLMLSPLPARLLHLLFADLVWLYLVALALCVGKEGEEIGLRKSH
ncbi:hypothetical protein EBR25_04765 [bacterium]|nr:hypothetical protein [bacterium]